MNRKRFRECGCGEKVELLVAVSENGGLQLHFKRQGESWSSDRVANRWIVELGGVVVE